MTEASEPPSELAELQSALEAARTRADEEQARAERIELQVKRIHVFKEEEFDDMRERFTAKRDQCTEFGKRSHEIREELAKMERAGDEELFRRVALCEAKAADNRQRQAEFEAESCRLQQVASQLQKDKAQLVIDQGKLRDEKSAAEKDREQKEKQLAAWQAQAADWSNRASALEAKGLLDLQAFRLTEAERQAKLLEFEKLQEHVQELKMEKQQLNTEKVTQEQSHKDKMAEKRALIDKKRDELRKAQEVRDQKIEAKKALCDQMAQAKKTELCGKIKEATEKGNKLAEKLKELQHSVAERQERRAQFEEKAPPAAAAQVASAQGPKECLDDSQVQREEIRQDAVKREKNLLEDELCKRRTQRDRHQAELARLKSALECKKKQSSKQPVLKVLLNHAKTLRQDIQSSANVATDEKEPAELFKMHLESLERLVKDCIHAAGKRKAGEGESLDYLTGRVNEALRATGNVVKALHALQVWRKQNRPAEDIVELRRLADVLFEAQDKLLRHKGRDFLRCRVMFLMIGCQCLTWTGAHKQCNSRDKQVREQYTHFKQKLARAKDSGFDGSKSLAFLQDMRSLQQKEGHAYNVLESVLRDTGPLNKAMRFCWLFSTALPKQQTKFTLAIARGIDREEDPKPSDTRLLMFSDVVVPEHTRDLKQNLGGFLRDVSLMIRQAMDSDRARQQSAVSASQGDSHGATPRAPMKRLRRIVAEPLFSSPPQKVLKGP